MSIKNLLLFAVAAFSAATAMAESKIVVPEEVTLKAGAETTVEISLQSDESITAFDLKASEFTVTVLDNGEESQIDGTVKWLAGPVIKAEDADEQPLFTYGVNSSNVYTAYSMSKAVMANGVICKVKFTVPDGFKGGKIVITGNLTNTNGDPTAVSATINLKEDTTTGINSVNAETSVKGGYTIAGTKAVNGQKGVRILNGKKFMVK